MRAVDGIGAAGADAAGRQVGDGPLMACRTDTDRAAWRAASKTVVLAFDAYPCGAYRSIGYRAGAQRHIIGIVCLRLTAQRQAAATQRSGVVAHCGTALTLRRRIALDQTHFVGAGVTDAYTIVGGVGDGRIASNISDGVAQLGDVQVGFVELGHVHSVAIGNAIGNVGNGGATRVRAIVVMVATQSNAIVGAVVVHHRIDSCPCNRALELCHVYRVAIGSTRRQAVDLAELAVGNITHGNAAQSAGGVVDRRRLRRSTTGRHETGDTRSGVSYRAPAQCNAVFSNSIAALSQSGGVLASLCLGPHDDRVIARGNGFGAQDNAHVLLSSRSLTHRNRAVLGTSYVTYSGSGDIAFATISIARVGARTDGDAAR
ncbi:hypothetical protein D3C77_220300 [compost metagenome]